MFVQNTVRVALLLAFDHISFYPFIPIHSLTIIRYCWTYCLWVHRNALCKLKLNTSSICICHFISPDCYSIISNETSVKSPSIKTQSNWRFECRPFQVLINSVSRPFIATDTHTHSLCSSMEIETKWPWLVPLDLAREKPWLFYNGKMALPLLFVTKKRSKSRASPHNAKQIANQ